MTDHNDPNNFGRDRNYLDYRLSQIEKIQDNHARDICKIRDTQIDIKDVLTARIDNVERLLNKKFDENKNYFSRYFIAILVTIIVSVVIGLFAFILNR